MLRIPKTIYQEMLDHAKRESPLECCGILGGKDKTVRRSFELENTEKSPVLYSMSPQEQMEVFDEMDRESLDMVAIYHSHPQTIPFPSETDVKLTFYPDVSSVIISLKEKENPVMKAFQVNRLGYWYNRRERNCYYSGWTNMCICYRRVSALSSEAELGGARP